jgi:integrase
LSRREKHRPDAALWVGKKFIIPKFGTRSWRDVRRSEIRDWHAAIKSPYYANRALQALRAALYWRLWSEDDAAGSDQHKRDTRNPSAGNGLHPETERQVRLEIDQLPKLERAIDASAADPYMRAHFRFLLATGCRRSEALKLEWRDVKLDGDAPSVTFRMTKAGADYQVPLSRFAVQLLKALPRVEGNPYVFVGHRRGTALKAPARQAGRSSAEPMPRDHTEVTTA